MAGVVLETLSNRKLILFGVVAFLVQVGFFFIGGLIAPKPNNVQTLLSNVCKDTVHNRDRWIYTRPDSGNCDRINDLEKEVYENEKHDITAYDIVFVFQFPNPRSGEELAMSRLHQSMVSILNMHIRCGDEYCEGIKSVMTMDVRLGYTDDIGKHANWTEIARSMEERPLDCVVGTNQTGYELECEMLPLFELGSVHHSQYLLNIRLPTHEVDPDVGPMNKDMGRLTELDVFVIHPNGGFTLVWMSLKTFVFPIIVLVLAWYIWRIYHLDRNPNILERSLIALGCALTILNIPVDWLTLVLHMPFMVLYSDIRQGLFYSVLLCFWIIFAGEHMMDQLERNSILHYWKHLSAVGFGCICLFVFEMCERGVQLTNPFYSIWATTSGRYLGLSFVILAGLAAGVYFIFLLSMIVRVFRNILAKKSALPSMSKPRRNFYMSLIYRFSFLMVFTLICAAMTVILFIIGNVSEGQWKWNDDSKLEYTSAVQTGVYGMWNIYVFCLLIFYAPSTKYIAVAAAEDSIEETVEFSTIPSEASALSSFVQKTTVD